MQGQIIKIISDNDINAIFIEKDSSDKIAKTISSETDAKIYFLDLITSGNGSLDDYESRMRNNINTIKESQKWNYDLESVTCVAQK